MSRLFEIVLIIFALTWMSGANAAWVFLCSGQSNMGGMGILGGLADSLKQELPRVKIWNTDKFVTVHAGSSYLNMGYLKRFGPEYNFAMTLTDSFPEEEIYLIKYSVSGCPLDKGFDNATWLGPDAGPGRENFYPGESETDPNIGVMYTKQMKRFADGLADLASSGIEYEIKGMIWMQGEADAKRAISAGRYAENLSNFIDRIHEDLDLNRRFGFVFGEVLPHGDSLPAKFRAPAELKVSQFNAHHSSRHRDSIPNAYIVPTGSFQLNKDWVHFGTEGIMSLGKAMADSMITALEPQVPVSILKRPAIMRQIGDGTVRNIRGEVIPNFYLRRKSGFLRHGAYIGGDVR